MIVWAGEEYGGLRIGSCPPSSSALHFFHMNPKASAGSCVEGKDLVKFEVSGKVWVRCYNDLWTQEISEKTNAINDEEKKQMDKQMND